MSKKKHNTILIHEVHDMWPATLIELGGMSKNHPFVRLLQIAENSAYKKSDKVVSILPNTEEYMMEHGLKRGNFSYIPNGVVKEEWKNANDIPVEIKKQLKELKEKGKYLVGYYGGHALSNALDTLLDAAKLLLENENISIILVGKGVEKERLIKRCVDEGIANIFFFDAIDKRTIPTLVEYFDCLYAGTMDIPLYRFGIGANKYFDSMMAGKPIVLSTNARNTVIEQSRCGVIVPACDSLAIAKAIVQISQMTTEELEVIRNNGKSAVEEQYMYDVLADRFEKEMGECPNKRILIINHYAGSPEMGMEFRPYYMAMEWIKKGYKVDIIASDYSHLRMKNPSVKKDFEEETIDGIHYHWVKTGTYNGNGIKRAITMFQFVGKLWIKSKMLVSELNPDVVITSSTYPLDTYIGQRIRKLQG